MPRLEVSRKPYNTHDVWRHPSELNKRGVATSRATRLVKRLRQRYLQRNALVKRAEFWPAELLGLNHSLEGVVNQGMFYWLSQHMALREVLCRSPTEPQDLKRLDIRVCASLVPGKLGPEMHPIEVCHVITWVVLYLRRRCICTRLGCNPIVGSAGILAPTQARRRAPLLVSACRNPPCAQSVLKY